MIQNLTIGQNGAVFTQTARHADLILETIQHDDGKEDTPNTKEHLSNKGSEDVTVVVKKLSKTPGINQSLRRHLFRLANSSLSAMHVRQSFESSSWMPGLGNGLAAQ
jgi:hypothetical protein